MFRRPVARRRGVGVLGATAVAGTAYAVGSSTARNQQRETTQEERLAQLEAEQAAAAAPPQAPAPAPAAAPPGTMTDEKIRQLKELAALKSSGVLTLQEFE